MAKTKQNNALQKGQRRKRLHDSQNNRGTEKNPPEYKNFQGETIE
ncbi:MAG: clostri-philic family protein [Clostridiaceae bacterium]